MARRTRRSWRAEMGVSLCSICDDLTVVFGDQRYGGIRFCSRCIPATLAYIQMSESERDQVQHKFSAYAARSDVATVLLSAAQVSEETRRALAFGEAQRRVVESEREG